MDDRTALIAILIFEAVVFTAWAVVVILRQRTRKVGGKVKPLRPWWSLKGYVHKGGINREYQSKVRPPAPPPMKPKCPPIRVTRESQGIPRGI